LTETPTSHTQRERPARAESILDAVEVAFGPEAERPSKGPANPPRPTPSPAPRPGPQLTALASPDPVERRKALERIALSGLSAAQAANVTRILL